MFTCGECGSHAPRWVGRCPRCGAWGSLQGAEEHARPPLRPVPLEEVAAHPVERRATGCQELDRVLGGGAVPGSVLLLGGEPGIGKSTLLLGVGARIGSACLYAAGEESPGQVALRARRLRLPGGGLFLLDSTDPEAIAAELRSSRPAFAVVDSIQTLRSGEVKGSAGGPSQVRAAAAVLVPAARESGTCLFLVGQVTKLGGLAGPRLLEHAVDAVLHFEGDRHHALRALRAVKNRFGATDEIGLFEMRDDGLREVSAASSLLLADRGPPGPGSVVGVALEGGRALCVEVQALLVGDDRPGARRRARGIDRRRAEILVGVVESLFCGRVAKRDVFLNVVGGLEVRDPGLDLAAAAALLGAALGASTDPTAVLVGEVGLRGEVRPVPRLAPRLKEARALGFLRAFVPRGGEGIDGLVTTAIERLDEVFRWREQGLPDHTAPPQGRRSVGTAP
ncbi:MAG: DNA repair protein RadA [Planctomycetaceae bacterium]